MRHDRTVITWVALFVALLLVASPAFGGEPRGVTSGGSQTRTEAAKGTGAGPVSDSAEADQARQQDRLRDEDCVPTACEDCVGDQTRTMTQGMTQQQTKECSASVDPVALRMMSRLGAANGEAALNVVRAEAQFGDLAGDAFSAMIRLAERLFAWMDAA
ncbi:MAG: hypothetical protein WBI63_08025 [Coriobacteriia bacterium]